MGVERNRVIHLVPLAAAVLLAQIGTVNAEAEVLAAGRYIQRYRDLATDFEVLEGGLAVRRFVDGKTVELGSGDTHTCKPDDSGVIAFDPERME